MVVVTMRYCLTPHCSVLVERGHCATHTKGEQVRPNVAVRRWYRTARWRAYRTAVLQAQPCCVACRREGRVTEATEVDHIQRHDGNAEKFWDSSNLQGLCAMHHAMKTQRGE